MNKKQLKILVLLTLFFLPFQNCSNVNSFKSVGEISTSTQSSSSPQSSGSNSSSNSGGGSGGSSGSSSGGSSNNSGNSSSSQTPVYVAPGVGAWRSQIIDTNKIYILGKTLDSIDLSSLTFLSQVICNGGMIGVTDAWSSAAYSPMADAIVYPWGGGHRSNCWGSAVFSDELGHDSPLPAMWRAPMNPNSMSAEAAAVAIDFYNDTKVSAYVASPSGKWGAIVGDNVTNVLPATVHHYSTVHTIPQADWGGSSDLILTSTQENFHITGGNSAGICFAVEAIAGATPFACSDNDSIAQTGSFHFSASVYDSKRKQIIQDAGSNKIAILPVPKINKKYNSWSFVTLQNERGGSDSGGYWNLSYFESVDKILYLGRSYGGSVSGIYLMNAADLSSGWLKPSNVKFLNGANFGDISGSSGLVNVKDKAGIEHAIYVEPTLNWVYIITPPNGAETNWVVDRVSLSGQWSATVVDDPTYSYAGTYGKLTFTKDSIFVVRFNSGKQLNAFKLSGF